MEIRRVVTGHDEAGKSTVVADVGPASVHAFRSIPGMQTALLGATLGDRPIPLDGGDPAAQVESWHPEARETRLMFITFPPDAVYGDPSFVPEAAGAEQFEAIPGLAEKFEPDAPGMHTTDTVDYGIVIEGEPVLELDDGETVSLRPGEVVIQNGTRHAWRNPGATPATIAFVLVGTRR